VARELGLTRAGHQLLDLLILAPDL